MKTALGLRIDIQLKLNEVSVLLTTSFFLDITSIVTIEKVVRSLCEIRLAGHCPTTVQDLI